MTLYKVQVVIPAVTGIARDAVVNTWGIEAVPDETTFKASYKAALLAWYDAWSGYRSATQLWTGTLIKLYRLTDTKPRVPLWNESLGLSSAVQTTALPNEVALVTSFQGLRVSGLKQARRRGRVFVGPLATVANASASGRPAAALITTLNTASRTLASASATAVDWEWVVISNTPTEGASWAAVSQGWTDDAFDTQRRRGLPIGARTTWSFP